MRNTTRYTSDWTQNWNGSIATKLTAIILWSVMIAAFVLTVPIMLTYEDHKLKDYLWVNQQIINLVETNINTQQPGLVIQDQLQSFIDKNEVEYISVTSNNVNISLGDSSGKNYQSPTARLLTDSNIPITISVQHQNLKRGLIIDRVILGGSILGGATIFGLFIFLVTRNVVHNPMRRFVDLTHKLSKGERDVRFDEARVDEFGELARFSNEMLNNLELQRKKLLDTNTELISEIQNREEALAASQQKSAFLANMSHEIRTPLSSIIGYTERLRYKNIKTKKEKNEMMDIVLQSSSHLLSLINDILDFSKIEANKLEMQAEEFSILSIISHTVDLLHDKAMEQSTRIEVEYNYPIPKYINNDATRTKQVLLNLCSNALRFTKNGIITIQVSYDKTSNQLVVAIKDTGIGMSEEVLGRLFKPFSQGEKSTSKDYGGTGLGLAISKKLCTLMGGDISVASTERLGSIFTFSIDAGVKQNHDLIYKADKTAIASNKYNKPVENVRLSGKVLLVEDTTEIRILVKAYLEDYGIDVTTADDGNMGVELALDSDFDVVLMDIHMPIMNGKEAVQLLRDQNYTGPIIALTADALTQQVEEFKALGFTQILTKPVVINELVAALCLYLDSGTNDGEPDSDHDTTRSVLDTEQGKSLVKKFISGLPDTLKTIDEAIANRDIELLKDIFHQLKGLGGSVGFPMVTQFAVDIEAPLEIEDFDAIKNKTNEFNKLCARISNLN